MRYLTSVNIKFGCKFNNKYYYYDFTSEKNNYWEE